ncbi:MAG: tRNA pseudouridine(38-40) synthase TruA [Acidimicrobiia bacterium]
MPTYRLDIAYDGSGFRGWARQENQRTVQGELEKALLTLLGAPIDIAVAGRTDAGVHARGQVASFPYGEEIDTEKLRRSLNGLVGPEIAVMALTVAEEGFHARFSARWRRYRYLIDVGPAPDPLARHFAWYVSRDLNFAAMAGVASAFVGEHDFSSFCRSVEGRSNVRRVEESQWRERDGFYEFWIRANAFCHQMVRSLVGYCYDVGRGFADPSRVEEVIEGEDRSLVSTVAPPHGLTLWEVGY